MNSELKPLLKAAYDLVTLGKDAVGKNWTKVFADLVQEGEDVPAVVSNWSSLKADLQALVSDPAADADALAYVASLIGGESPATAAVVSSIADFAITAFEKGEAVYKAIEATKAPAAAPAAPQAAQ